mmetsp:Transcript_70915/g.122917  ORF Transcript_70915/g.122917 Transcript_70915/m.122917 type:complete len:441 (-) Transcript_70915:354-1676(-)
MRTTLRLAVVLCGSLAAAELKLVTFDGAEVTTASWRDMNDPVMGGASKSSFAVTANRTGLFHGTCAIVSFLKAPGFAKIMGSAKFADITGYDSIALKVKSSTPHYQGFKIAFGAPGIPKSSVFTTGSYKADFNLSGSAWQLVEVPLSKFSRDWSAYTGRCDTKDPDSLFMKGKQHYCCDKSGLQPSKPEVCVDSKYLSKIDGVEVWAEGVEGDFSIEIDWIGATKSLAETTPAAQGSLVTFDSSPGTTFTFKELNDPVMGGKSVGTWSLGDGFGVLDGEVVNVPSLKAPGFIKAAADGKFPDISEFIDGSLVLLVRSSTPDYAGYRVTFVSGAMSPSFSCAGGGSLPFSRGCFKQKFGVPAGSDFVEVKLPFAGFSDKWSPATGEQTEECAKNKDVCPTAAKLGKIQRIEFWGEGAVGKLHLEVKSVYAEKASGERMVVV